MVKTIDGKLFRFKSRVIVHVPMKLARDSAFPFPGNEGHEDIIIEIKGKSLVIRKGEKWSTKK